MGLLQAIRQRQLHEKGLEYVRADGRRVAAMPADTVRWGWAGRGDRDPPGDLAEVLAEATHDVEYLYGDSITELEQEADGVDVTFASGLRRRFDLVIGADGVHSRVRRLAFGPHERFVHHLGGYSSYFTVEAPEDLNHWMKVYTAPGGLWVGLRPDHDPRFAKALLSFRSSVIDYNYRDVAAQKALLPSGSRALGWHTEHLLAALPTAEDFYFDSTSRVVVPEWSQGRVALVGDAGYCGSPLAGHGTALALVGAYVLAGELAADGDHVRAFAAYQRRMQAYVHQRMELPPGGIKMAMPMTAAGIRYRDTMTRLMTSKLLVGAMGKLMVGKPDAIELPDYSALPLRVAAEETE